ncbi:unnamed protein product [Polarella glacialis]|uniref:Protein xylosyltransferase n=1 Tax=Polarella glacialis TaxID=89957 RepID=A0A813DXS5_POLGL|nr:unnamed protein product [Polarella glacialis]CAE8692802.1 unnamed protein product [Polarella glacialis]
MPSRQRDGFRRYRSGIWGLSARWALFGPCLWKLVSADPRELRVQVNIPSAWQNLGLRLQLRRTLGRCGRQLQADGYLVEQLFFMGNPETSGFNVEEALREIQAFGDLVTLTAPDVDPPVSAEMIEQASGDPDLEKLIVGWPSSVGMRIAASMVWLLHNRPDFDYVVHLSDSSLARLPDLLREVSRHDNSSLVLGWLKESTSLTVAGGAQDGEVPCENCLEPPEQVRFCLDMIQTSMAGMDYRGCMRVAARCCNGASDCGYDDLLECSKPARTVGFNAALYYGTALAPRSPHPAAWVLGRRPAEFVAENSHDLRMRGASEVLLGFWLAALEDLHFVSLPLGQLLSIPEGASCASGAAPPLVVYGLDEDSWPRWFDEETCEIHCGWGGRLEED